jgi:Putative transposase
MTLSIDEFTRRWLIHVLPSGFHSIRHHGLSATAIPTHLLAKTPAETQDKMAIIF